MVPVVKKRRKRKDESEPVSALDDSGDELKVKFAREVCYKVQDGTPGLKRQHNTVMEVDTYSSKPYYTRSSGTSSAVCRFFFL